VEELNQLSNRFQEAQARLLEAVHHRDSLVRRRDATEELVASLTQESEVLAKVADLFRNLLDQEIVGNAKTAETLLTEGLGVIFDDQTISVRADVEVQRGKVSVQFNTIQKKSDGVEVVGSVTDSYGGAVATVQSVLLRIVVLTRRGLRPLLLLDESLAAINEQYIPRVARFLSLLSDRLGLDILAVTHNPTLVEEADTAYRIQAQKGAAVFKPLQRKK
jgi:hypothetical protein